MRLRSHLIAVVCAALVPVLGFAAFVSRENARLQIAATERGMRETAHAVARIVDKELETAITTLEALAELDPQESGDLTAFWALSQRVARSQGWTSIVLFAPDGRGLMHTLYPLTAPAPATVNPTPFRQAIAERRPTVSNLFDGARHQQIVAVYVPIVRDGVVRSVISAALPVSAFGELLRAQQFGPGSVAVIQDREHVIVARTRGETEMVGRRVRNPSQGQEGWVKSRLTEGTEVYVAYVTAPFAGWRVVLTVPVAVVDAPLVRGVWQMLAGAAAAAAIAGLLAFLFGRRIANAVGALVGIARSVERGERPVPLSTGVTEVDAVAVQLSLAAGLAQAREREAATGERQARAIGEVAAALNASPDLDTILLTAVGAARTLTGADGARIAIVDDAGRLVLRHSTQVSTIMTPGFVIERGHGMGGLAWQTGEPVRTDDFRTDPRFRGDRYQPIAEADGIVSCMTVPIATAGTVVGVIYVNNLSRRPFSASDEALLVTLAHHAAVAVQKARLLAREGAARAEAEAASRGKDELLAMLGHELRNPLAAIANAVGVLAMASAPPEVARRAREIIARQNTHLAHLVDDLLDVARVTSGKIALERRPVELADAVRHSVQTLTASGRTERHHVTLELQPVWADVDETRFEQVVANLVGNALRFTPAGGDIAISLRPEDDMAVLQVRDSGIGIAPEMLPRIFDLFVQGERSADRGTGGLGLGLTLVRRIAELHGGRAEAGSEGPGRGSVFTVRVPATAAPAATATRPAIGGESVPRRVLVVEDNADAREMVRLVLELAGHEVHEAVDGPSGLAALLELRPDLALVDIGLPGFDGLTLARRAREAVGTAVALVALTGYGQPDDRRNALDAGFDAHLVKPLEPAALLATIQARAVPKGHPHAHTS